MKNSLIPFYVNYHGVRTSKYYLHPRRLYCCCPRESFSRNFPSIVTVNLSFRLLHTEIQRNNSIFSHSRPFHRILIESRTFSTRDLPHNTRSSDWNNSDWNFIWNCCQILQCPVRDFKDFYLKSVHLFKKTKSEDFIDILTCFKSLKLNIDTEYLKKNLWLLETAQVSEKLYVLQEFVPAVKLDYLLLLRMSLGSLKRCSLEWSMDHKILMGNYASRLEYLTEMLDWNVRELCRMASSKHYPLVTFELERINSVLKLLLNNGVDPESIRRDLWIIRHNISVMEERLKICQDKNVPVKVWFLRAKQEIFDTSIKRFIRNQQVLSKYKDTANYLANELHCDRNTIIAIGQKNLNILKINPIKLEESLKFFLHHGFMRKQIINYPRILTASVETCEYRLQTLIDCRYPNIKNCFWILTVETKRFRKIVDRLKRKMFMDNMSTEGRKKSADSSI